MWLVEPRGKNGQPIAGLRFDDPDTGPPRRAGGTGLMNRLPNGAVSVAPLSEVEPGSLTGDEAAVNEAYKWAPVVHLDAGRVFNLREPVYVPPNGKLYLQDAAVDRGKIVLGEGACIVDDCHPGNGGNGGGGLPYGYYAAVPGTSVSPASEPFNPFYEFDLPNPGVPANADLAMIAFWASVDSGSPISFSLRNSEMEIYSVNNPAYHWPGGERGFFHTFTWVQPVSAGGDVEFEISFANNQASTGDTVWFDAAGIGITFMQNY